MDQLVDPLRKRHLFCIMCKNSFEREIVNINVHIGKKSNMGRDQHQKHTI